MAKKARNRESGCAIATGTCARMSTCELSHKGKGTCAKNKCAKFLDPKDPKVKK